MNTRIDYMYRDASNYKSNGYIILPGEIASEEVDKIISSLEDGEYFIPEQVGIPACRLDELSDDDHCYHELSREDFSLTEEELTMSVAPSELTEKFVSIGSDGWDSVKYAI